MGLLILPVGLAVARFTWIQWDLRRAEREAMAELAWPTPPPAAYGVLGGIRLDQGRLTEALPLLKKAAALEAAAGAGSRDTLSLAKALIEAGRGDEAAPVLRQAEALVARQARGQQARTLFSAGLFWRQLGQKSLAEADLARAVALQPDDWVDFGGGRREKAAGLAAYYQKMLAATQQDR
jgi:tetratricopeptide (TPR) repeat protein